MNDAEMAKAFEAMLQMRIASSMLSEATLELDRGAKILEELIRVYMGMTKEGTDAEKISD